MDPELFDKMIVDTARRITQLRTETAKHRIERNEARAELAHLKDAVRRWRSSTGEGFGLGSYYGADDDLKLLDV